VAWRQRFVTGIAIAIALPLLMATPSTAQQWPDVPPEALRAPWLAKPFSFQAGARYWYSSGTINFGFSNTNALFGDPTSTIDWNKLIAHTGEIFARIDHRPTGLYVKGLIGGGNIVSGKMEDRDFLAGQFTFSDTNSDVNDGQIRYGMIDVGVVVAEPSPNARFGAFVGYHYWRERVTAYGLTCNADDVGGVLCGAPGTTVIPYNVAVLIYQPTWHAARIGFDGRLQIDNSWSIAGEFAAIPYAKLHNDDSHLLRQSMADLGPAPNILTKDKWGYGAEAEVFVNYALTSHLEFGAGLRYWGLFTQLGDVEFGPSFAAGYPLTSFYQQRYGVLLQLKGTF
jgi:hypothetical protein